MGSSGSSKPVFIGVQVSNVHAQVEVQRRRRSEKRTFREADVQRELEEGICADDGNKRNLLSCAALCVCTFFSRVPCLPMQAMKARNGTTATLLPSPYMASWVKRVDLWAYVLGAHALAGNAGSRYCGHGSAGEPRQKSR